MRLLRGARVHTTAGRIVDSRAIHAPDTPMLDLLYVALTLTFFALMLAYVAGCARLGGAGATADPGSPAATRRGHGP